MSLFERVVHPWEQSRQESGAPKHETGPGFNGRLALAITNRVGTMWCAYVFAALALFSLPSALASGNIVTIVSWVSQTFLQLVLLSIIIVGQNIMATASDKRAEATYNDAELVLHECLELQRHLQEQDEILTKLVVHRTPGPRKPRVVKPEG